MSNEQRATGDVFAELTKLSGPIIEYYRDDLLVWDREWLERWPGVPFIHYSRQCGSQICGLQPFAQIDQDDKQPAVRATIDYIDYWNNSDEPKLTLYFDGTALRKISKSKAVEIVALWADRIMCEQRLLFETCGS